jgi:hypothetical protein
MYDQDEMINYGRFSRPHNWLIRTTLVTIGIVPIIFAKKFYEHFYAYLTGNVVTRIIKSQWHITTYIPHPKITIFDYFLFLLKQAVGTV